MKDDKLSDEGLPSTEYLISFYKGSQRGAYDLIIADRLKSLSDKNQQLKHTLSVIDVIDMWPLWKILAVDSFTLKKGSILDRYIECDKENELLKAKNQEHTKEFQKLSKIYLDEGKETIKLKARIEELEKD